MLLCCVLYLCLVVASVVLFVWGLLCFDLLRGACSVCMCVFVCVFVCCGLCLFCVGACVLLGWCCLCLVCLGLVCARAVVVCVVCDCVCFVLIVVVLFGVCCCCVLLCLLCVQRFGVRGFGCCLALR